LTNNFFGYTIINKLKNHFVEGDRCIPYTYRELFDGVKQQYKYTQITPENISE